MIYTYIIHADTDTHTHVTYVFVWCGLKNAMEKFYVKLVRFIFEHHWNNIGMNRSMLTLEHQTFAFNRKSFKMEWKMGCNRNK